MEKKITDDFGVFLCPKCGSNYTHILSVYVEPSAGANTKTEVSGRKVDISNIDHLHGGADNRVRINFYCEECGGPNWSPDAKEFEKEIREHVPSVCFYAEFRHHEGQTVLEIK